MTDLVLQKAHDLGFDLAGVCDARPPESLSILESWIAQGFHGTMEYLPRSLPLRGDPATLLPGVKSIIAVGLNYYQGNTAQEGAPRIAKYALGRDYHKTIRSKLKKLAAFVSEAFPASLCRVCVDSAPILEREYAQRAGLGWFGKNTCLINSQRGSWFLIGILLTTAELEHTADALGGCGTCTKCIDACPTGAIVPMGDRWQVDARRCISYLTIEHRGEIADELKREVGEWTFGCDVCQDVCPFNQRRESQPLRAKVTLEPDFMKLRTWPQLEQLAVIGQEEWDTLTQGSPVRRAGLDGLQRNARINLENAQVPSQGAQRRK